MVPQAPAAVLYNRCMKTASTPTGNQAAFTALHGGVTLMQAMFTDHAFERHSHDCFALGVTTHGVQRFRCRGGRHDSRPGDCVLFNPDEDHDGGRGTDVGFGYTIWYLPEAFVATCVDNRNRYFAAPHVTDPPMAATFARLSADLMASPPESLRAESMLRTFVGRMLHRHGEHPQPDGKPRPASDAALARVKDHIRAHCQDDITVADLAAVAGLSRAHLTRAFAARYRIAPHVYLNAVRIVRAQSLIRLGMPLAQVALECGFADQSHFTRRFKGSVGVAPSAWRDMPWRKLPS
jgi:AraC-like DNA-binding protein